VGSFLREYWPWIVVPLLLALAGAALLWVMTAGPSAGPGVYTLF